MGDRVIVLQDVHKIVAKYFYKQGIVLVTLTGWRGGAEKHNYKLEKRTTVRVEMDSFLLCELTKIARSATDRELESALTKARDLKEAATVKSVKLD